MPQKEQPERENAVSTASVIRGRIEENAIQDCLKTSMGGYSKKSVQEYIARIRKQQQLMSENFNLEMKRVLDEKEHLAEENSQLSERLNKTSADYRALTETITTYKLEDSDYTLDDVIRLKSALEALQKEKDGLNDSLCQKGQELERLEAGLRDSEAAVGRAKQETRTCQEMLVAEKNECNAQRKAVSDLSAKLEEQRAQLAYLNGIVSEGNVAELKASIASLSQNSALQETLIGQKNDQIEASRQETETLSAQLAELRETSGRLSQSVDSLMLQNEKLAASSKALNDKLREALEQSVALLSEKAQLNVEKLLAERKLEALRLKVSNAEAGVSQ